MNSSNWKSIGNKSANALYTMNGENGLKMIKGEGTIDFSAQDIVEYFTRENVK